MKTQYFECPKSLGGCGTGYHRSELIAGVCPVDGGAVLRTANSQALEISEG